MLLFLILAIALVIGGYLGYNYFSGNVHTVIPDKIYRSGQMDHKQLTYYTKKFGLKTIINLRGSWPNDHWYQVESKFAKAHNLNYYPIQFKAYSLPTKKRLRLLVHTLMTAKKPLVFHCEGGADRTGLASEISLILFAKDPSISQIEHQASWRYNAISPKTVGYQVMRNYIAWLKQYHLVQSKRHFLQWIDSPVKMRPYHGWFLL